MGGKLIFFAAVGSPTSQGLPSIGWEVYNYNIGCHSQQCVHACIQREEASTVSVPYSNWVAIQSDTTQQPILKLETPIPNCITEDHRGNETHKRRQPTSFISRNNATMCGKLGSESFAVFSRLLVFHSGRGRSQTSSSNIGKRECRGWVGGCSGWKLRGVGRWRERRDERSRSGPNS